MSTGEENLVLTIPNDLIVEIFSRLPAESVARWRCLSKLWASILHRPYFTELFLTRSRARPRLLFSSLNRKRTWSFYSLPQLQHDLHEKAGAPPPVAYPDFHMKFPEDMYYPKYNGFTSGLFYFSSTGIAPKSQEEAVICNPKTGQYATLPKLSRYGKTFLGFDPIGKQFKVLSMDHACCSSSRCPNKRHRVLTLGNGKMEWKEIQCSPFYFRHIRAKGICINGILYFSPKRRRCLPHDVKIVCFDVRSEKFERIDVEWDHSLYVKMVNYKGKLGVVTWKGLYELRISVLEDVEKQEWSKYVYTLPENDILDSTKYIIAGVTATSEIVFSRKYTRGPFYVVYFSLERNTLQSVEIQGLENGHRVCAYVDLVEDLNVNDAKYLKSGPPQNVITISPKPQEKLNSVPSVKKKQSTSLLLQENKQSTSLLLQNYKQSTSLLLQNYKQSTNLLWNKYDMLANLDD